MMEHFKFYIFSGLLIFLAFTNSNFAQWNVNIATLQEYNDNTFHSPFPEDSFISTLNLSVEKSFNALSIGYYGNYANFSNITDRNYYWHQLGVWKTTNNFMYGLNVEQRLNGTDYDFFNYMNYSGYLKYRLNIHNIYIFGNSSINITDYNKLNDLDNMLGTINITANKSFKTKTTLIGGLDFKYKNYFNTSFSSLENLNNLVLNSNSAYTTQFNFFIKIAQSLSPTTGLAVQYSNRNIIGGTAKTIRQLDFAYGDESKYFDDPISYEGSTASIQLTQILPWEIILRGSFFYNTKAYPSQGAYIQADKYNSEITRDDTQKIFNLGAQKKVYFGKQENTSLSLILNYQYIDNSSNSFWYDYSSNKINFGLSFNF